MSCSMTSALVAAAKQMMAAATSAADTSASFRRLAQSMPRGPRLMPIRAKKGGGYHGSPTKGRNRTNRARIAAWQAWAVSQANG